jgi:mannose-1-phosphate guanylyltransferase
MPTPLYAVILAGGAGSRLWPRSRTHHPKQFLKITGETTMLQQTRARIQPLVPARKTIVVTNEQYRETVAAQLPDLPDENILGEPVGRGSAAAIGLAAIHLVRRDPEAIMAILTADHLIRDVEAFRSAIREAAFLAAEGWLVTLGITPDYPETGYGYIERGEFLGTVGEFDGYSVRRFVEKPDLARAVQYLAGGNHDWNSGMFVWEVGRILEEMKRHLPGLYAALMEIEKHIGAPSYAAALGEVFPRIPGVTVDYGIMEKAEKVAVLPVEIGWNDVGSWSAVYDVLPKDEKGNAVVGSHLSPDTTNSLVYSPGRLVATIGLDNLVVVDTDDVLLIARRERAQDVRVLVEMLKQNGEAAYLDGKTAAAVAEPLTKEMLARVLELASPRERVLVSLLGHAGLWPSTIARLTSADLDLIKGWVATAEGKRPLPEATRGYLYAWMQEQDTLKFDLGQVWGSSEAVKNAVARLGERAGLPLSVDILYETLARTLLEVSEEGEMLRNVLGDEAGLVRVPLHALFPFSVPDFTGLENDPQGERAHRMLNLAAEHATRHT